MKKTGVQIHKPSIPKGESYIFVRCFIRNISGKVIGEENFKFYLETGIIEIKGFRDKEFRRAYPSDSFSESHIDVLKGFIENYFKDYPDQVESIKE